ncbi:iron ABC transporter ATP-binding protein [Mycetocola sp. 2940]|uniref:iron ABC transporter ATP-binding protein n=1 Tax=Mycetocola sp. 2940 TaxID=3156452 RepID=UPI003398690A
MASSFARTRPLRPFAVAAALLGSLLLAGCAPAAAPSSSATPTPGASDGTAAPIASPTPTETPVMSEPVDIACDALITPDDMYAINPNVSLMTESTPKADSLAAEIAAMNGLTCQWVHNTSNEVLDIALAKLPEKELTDLKNRAVTESTQVPTYAAPPVEGFFTVVGDEGEAQVFTGSYWLTLRGMSFFEPGDAEQLAEAAIGHLS